MEKKMSEEESKEIFDKNVKGWINHGLELTVDLVRLDSQRRPLCGFCSGFLIERNGKVYVLSAGHGLGRGKWYLQTHVADHTAAQSVLIPMNGVFTLTSIRLPAEGDGAIRSIDFAWCEVSFEALAREMKAKPYLIEEKQFFRYRGPLDTNPLADVPYTYAAHNRVQYGDAIRSYLDQEASYETCMEYDGVEEEQGIYRFKLARRHQGHAYYKGASGSPIFAPDGTIVSLLLRGNPRKDVLYGLPLSQYQVCVGLGS